ncbi:hypothetical protein CCUS01_03956 [Colletotrichum cuscutae]|uniref:Uncharacterized protein n=1 Tax=Colletotrichum cuscutae TaxID=1209917 RepID=A0AAI9VEK7_9PEZI|nr:hypothetical protein CCUS01_03956 [Colletotrichum cuscutae]
MTFEDSREYPTKPLAIGWAEARFVGCSLGEKLAFTASSPANRWKLPLADDPTREQLDAVQGQSYAFEDLDGIIYVNYLGNGGLESGDARISSAPPLRRRPVGAGNASSWLRGLVVQGSSFAWTFSWASRGFGKSNHSRPDTSYKAGQSQQYILRALQSTQDDQQPTHKLCPWPATNLPLVPDSYLNQGEGFNRDSVPLAKRPRTTRLVPLTTGSKPPGPFKDLYQYQATRCRSNLSPFKYYLKIFLIPKSTAFEPRYPARKPMLRPDSAKALPC